MHDTDYKKYINIEFNKELFKLNELINAPLSEDQLKVKSAETSFEDKEFFVDQFRWVSVRRQMPVKWLHELYFISRRIQERTALFTEYNRFYILICSLLFDLKDDFFAPAEVSFNGIITKPTEQQNSIHSLILSELNAMRSDLSDVERESIYFLRDQNAHIIIDSYKVSKNKKGQVHNYHNRSGMNKIINTNRIIHFMFKKYPSTVGGFEGYDSNFFADDLSIRFHSNFKELYELFEELSTLPFVIIR